MIDNLVFNFIRPPSLCSAVCQLARPQQQGLGCSNSGHVEDAGGCMAAAVVAARTMPGGQPEPSPAATGVRGWALVVLEGRERLNRHLQQALHVAGTWESPIQLPSPSLQPAQLLNAEAQKGEA